jgi:hypothetical protein
VPWL